MCEVGGTGNVGETDLEHAVAAVLCYNRAVNAAGRVVTEAILHQIGDDLVVGVAQFALEAEAAVIGVGIVGDQLCATCDRENGSGVRRLSYWLN